MQIINSFSKNVDFENEQIIRKPHNDTLFTEQLYSSFGAIAVTYEM